MNITQSIRRLAAVCVALASFSALHAASYDFNFSANPANEYETSRTFSSTPSGLQVTVTANSFYNGSFTGNSKVGQWAGNGLGVKSPNDNSHTVDSSGKTDYLMFAFSEALDVNKVSIGFVLSGYDSQFKYWIQNSGIWGSFGAPDGTSGGTNGSLGNWDINSANEFGSYLIIAASNSDAGYGDASNAGFKVKSLNVTTRNNVPDGGSVVAMVGASLLALVAFRRRFVR